MPALPLPDVSRTISAQHLRQCVCPWRARPRQPAQSPPSGRVSPVEYALGAVTFVGKVLGEEQDASGMRPDLLRPCRKEGVEPV